MLAIHDSTRIANRITTNEIKNSIIAKVSKGKSKLMSSIIAK